ncbi:phosphate ABC transporter ATP-binding protein PstB [Proteiniclasticum sp. QWL-01]|uniref:phosphate ABC transporter ATP-binding protein PstB n=1 Tax=Proteiniclasticum sp. QWL-01 TaxID=3036945 RepID=UPI002200A5F7|nr:phosphate ABC transporter ATP-binding protein PstB [Proteiniclasticum sp. QWL-01]UUM12966.1 phosphate ABC transporter ATP-binding protein PstB [Clostridiaceae bacterium HFYG-1003]WFF71391.1 phosphate ABC transporter ATP-binding protein PstB [Proteiniclasticum sp. QWL-01]
MEQELQEKFNQAKSVDQSVLPKAQREVKAQVALRERSPEEIPGETIIRVREMNFWYDQFQALKNLNLDIRENEITALIGPSGCGKSTFLRCLNRMNDLIPKTRVEGALEFKGRDINRDMDIMVLRKQIGMVFQKPNPFDMSVYDNIAFGPRIHGMKKKQELDELVERSLRKAAIWDEIKDRLHDNGLSISGGQQQRLCIARTLSTNPSIILMDEPTSALDPISTQKIEELMEELKKEYTVVIVTHNMQQAGRTADETVFFLNGEIVESGRTDKIFTNPLDKRTEEYITGRFG